MPRPATHGIITPMRISTHQSLFLMLLLSGSMRFSCLGEEAMERTKMKSALSIYTEDQAKKKVDKIMEPLRNK